MGSFKKETERRLRFPGGDKKELEKVIRVEDLERERKLDVKSKKEGRTGERGHKGTQERIS
jgi:hypothetical protein